MKGTGKVKTKHLFCLAKKANIVCDPNWSLDCVTAQKIAAFKAKKEATLKADTLRDQFIDAFEDQAETEEQPHQAAKLKAKRQREYER